MEQVKNHTKFLKIYMIDQCILLPLHQVNIVLRLPALQDVPSNAKGFEGILNYHGTSVPVYNLGAWLGDAAPQYTLDTPLILCEFDDELIGLLVSNVDDVITVPEHEINRPKLSDLPDFVRGMYLCENESMWVMQLDKLMALHQSPLSTSDE